MTIQSRIEGLSQQEVDYVGEIPTLIQQQSNLQPFILESLQAIAEQVPEAKVAMNIHTKINKDVISNQIIRYKDINKLEEKNLVVPFVVYATIEDQTKGLILVPGSEKDYVFAKGLYYCLTEQDGLFQEEKNDLVTLSMGNNQEAAKIFKELFTRKAGAIQREVDQQCFHSYEELLQDAIHVSKALREETPNRLKDEATKQSEIAYLVSHWFLLKKVVYVQYMMNKSILQTVHGGDVKAQRGQAKRNTEEIQFIPFSELWRMKAETIGTSETSEA